MKLEYLVNNGDTNITIAVKVGDLLLFAERLIEKVKRELPLPQTTEEPNKLIPAKQLCEMLAIKLPTLYKWQRQGYIVPVHIGGRTYYRHSDILSINKGCKIGEHSMTKPIYKSKLKIDRLFVKVPINLKSLLSQNERDFLEAVIHLQSLGKRHTSDSLIMANSGLNSNQITGAKRNLIALGLLTVKSDQGSRGSIYVVNTKHYNALVEQLNSIRNAPQRFETGDSVRKEYGLKAIFSNIINTLLRSNAETSLSDEECLLVVQPPTHSQSIEEQRALLKAQYETQEITIEEYRSKIKKIKL